MPVPHRTRATTEQTPRTPGSRRAVAAPKKRRFTSPAVFGVAVLALAGFGATSFENVPEPGGVSAVALQAVGQNYVGINSSNGTNAVDVTRDFDRQKAIQDEAQASYLAKVLEENNSSVVKQNEERKDEIVRNQWVLPVTGYHLTARFGQSSGLWSSGHHTGLDFAGPSGTPITSVAAGTVTSAGYEGSYGNRTIVTLNDGTEIWYCHQSRIDVAVGEKVAPGDRIGYTGSTGNVTGPHLHLEVHPGGGGPADPFAALVAHGVTP